MPEKHEHPADKAARKESRDRKAESAAQVFEVVQRHAKQGKHAKGYVGRHRKNP